MKVVRIKNVGHADILRHSRQVKRQRAFRKLAWFAGILLCLLIAVPLVLNNHRLLITEVRVAGARTIDPQTLTEEINKILDGRYAYLVSKRSIWLYPKGEILAALQTKFPTIFAAEMSLVDHRMIAKITERRGVSLWCPAPELSTACYFADQTGLIFAAAPSFSSQIFPVFNAKLAAEPIGTRPFPAAAYARILDFQKALNQLVHSDALNLGSVYRIDAMSAPDLVFAVDSADNPERSFKISVAADQDLEQALIGLRAALTSDTLRQNLNKPGEILDYLDLRFPPKVFYKFRAGV